MPRRRLILLVLTLGLVGAMPAAAQEPEPEADVEESRGGLRPRLGLAIGPSFTRLTVDLRDREAPGYDVVLGFHVGVIVGLDAGPATLRTGLHLLNSGALFDGSEFLNEDEFRVNFLTIPVEGRLDFRRRGLVHPYLFAGPEFRFLFSLDDRDINFRDDLRRLSATGAVGVGVEFEAPWGLPVGLSPELAYVFDLTGIYDGEFVRDDAGIVETASAIRANMVRLGFGLNF